jgi:hypothetical protein
MSDSPASPSPPAPAAEKSHTIMRPPFVVLAVVFVVGLVVAINAPSLVAKRTQSRYLQVASEAKTAVTQALTYSADKGSYPVSLKVLREAKYADVPDTDPWGNAYVLAPVLARGGKPQAGEDVYVYSRGSDGTGTYTPEKWAWGSERTAHAGVHQAAGYSSLYGSFSGM